MTSGIEVVPATCRHVCEPPACGQLLVNPACKARLLHNPAEHVTPNTPREDVLLNPLQCVVELTVLRT